MKDNTPFDYGGFIPPDQLHPDAFSWVEPTWLEIIRREITSARVAWLIAAITVTGTAVLMALS